MNYVIVSQNKTKAYKELVKVQGYKFKTENQEENGTDMQC